MNRPSDIDRLVFELSDATRSLGAERGTDLLLVLVYLRWRTAPRAEGAWDSLRNASAHRDPFEFLDGLERQLPDHVRSASSLPGLVEEDDGRAMRFAIPALDRLDVEDMPAAAYAGHVTADATVYAAEISLEAIAPSGRSLRPGQLACGHVHCHRRALPPSSRSRHSPHR